VLSSLQAQEVPIIAHRSLAISSGAAKRAEERDSKQFGQAGNKRVASDPARRSADLATRPGRNKIAELLAEIYTFCYHSKYGDYFLAKARKDCIRSLAPESVKRDLSDQNRESAQG
jgi:hypothetical protein